MKAQPTKVTLRPTEFEWSELVEIQASLPPSNWKFDQPKHTTTEGATEGLINRSEDLEAPALDLRNGNDHLLPDGGMYQGDIERLGACSGFVGIPPASLSTIAQPDGMDSFGSFFYPANGAGGVGPNHLMTMAANITLIQDRLGASISSVDTITFWSPLTPPSVTYCRLDYDLNSDRWIATARGDSGFTSTIMFAISDTSDPTGGWDFYSIPADPGAATFPDGLKMGYNTKWVVVAADMYSSTVAGGNQGSRLYTFDMQAAIAGGPVTANTFPADFTFTTTGLFNGLVNWRNVPVRSLDDSVSDLWLFNSRATSGTNVAWMAIRVTGTGAAPAVVATPGSAFGGNLSLMFIPLNYSNLRQAVFQVGDVRLIDPLQPDGTFASTRARLSDAVVRNGHVYIVHNAGLPGPNNAAATENGVCFYELDPTLPFGFDGGTAIGPFIQDVQITEGINTTLMYPSIAVNCANDVLIGCTRADATKDLEAVYMMRLGTDPLNTMGPTTLLKAGESSWWQSTATLAPWGLYSSTAVDPNDERTLWTLQPYAGTRVGIADADSRWGTWWGRLGDCETLPVITDQPDSDMGCVGDAFSFSVTATTGANPLTYQWRHNGVDILGATSDTYSIPSAVLADAGAYEVVICGCGEVVSQVANLVFFEPAITTQPADYVADLGDPAAFFVVATPNIGSLSYQWYHYGTPVGIDDDILAIGPVTGADYGHYSCVVTDACGPVTTATARLIKANPKNTVKQGELSLGILQHPSSTNACLGQSVELEVIAFPEGVSYLWRKNGTPIAPPETNSTLVLDPVMVGDGGIYDVVVSLGSQTKTSTPASVTEIDLPVISVQPGPGSQTVNVGSNVVYTMMATGDGPLTYQWQHKSNAQGAPFVDIPNQSLNVLILPSVSGSNSGTYRCRVTNECGTVRTINLRLIVV